MLTISGGIRRTLALLVAVPFSVALLTACGGDEVSVPGGSVKVDKSGKTGTIKTTDGSLTAGESMPKGFPDDVRVVKGKVVAGIAAKNGDTRTFNVVIETKGSAKDVAEDASELLTDKGFTEKSNALVEKAAMLTMERDDWELAVHVAEEDGKTTAVYSLNEK